MVHSHWWRLLLLEFDKFRYTAPLIKNHSISATLGPSNEHLLQLLSYLGFLAMCKLHGNCFGKLLCYVIMLSVFSIFCMTAPLKHYKPASFFLTLPPSWLGLGLH